MGLMNSATKGCSMSNAFFWEWAAAWNALNLNLSPYEPTARRPAIVCRQKLQVASWVQVAFPKGPCTQIVYTLGPMYPYREYFKAKV